MTLEEKKGLGRSWIEVRSAGCDHNTNNYSVVVISSGYYCRYVPQNTRGHKPPLNQGESGLLVMIPLLWYLILGREQLDGPNGPKLIRELHFHFSVNLCVPFGYVSNFISSTHRRAVLMHTFLVVYSSGEFIVGCVRYGRCGTRGFVLFIWGNYHHT